METRAQDLVIVGAIQPKIERYVVAEPLVGERAEQVYEGVRKIADGYKGAKAFSQHWGFDKNAGQITGSSLFHLVVANSPEVLGSMGLRTPTYEEGRMLDSQGKLSNGVYRDFELVVFGEEGDNEDVRKRLIGTLAPVFPLKVHPKALQLIEGKTRYGLGLSFRNFPTGVIQGDEVQRAIDSCDYKASSGVHGLNRRGGGDWFANWDDLHYSNAGGRVDFVCREATASEILEADKKAVQLTFNAQIRDLQTKRDEFFAQLDKQK